MNPWRQVAALVQRWNAVKVQFVTRMERRFFAAYTGEGRMLGARVLWVKRFGWARDLLSGGMFLVLSLLLVETQIRRRSLRSYFGVQTSDAIHTTTFRQRSWEEKPRASL